MGSEMVAVSPLLPKPGSPLPGDRIAAKSAEPPIALPRD
jgi:hypothetical protein